MLGADCSAKCLQKTKPSRISPPSTLSMKRRAEKAKASRAPENESRLTRNHNDGDGDHCSIGGEIDNKQETFACPFYRRYPLRFLECINVRLVTISVVKQHLKRRHVSRSSCSVCGNGSLSSKRSDVYTRERSCSRCERDDLYSIPSCTLDGLRLRCTRGISPEDQWHEIWVILFGTLDASPKPLSQGVVKEITGIIRDIWNKDGSQIISSCLQARGMPIGSGQLLSLLPEFLDRVEERFERKPPESNENEQTPITEKAVMEATLGGTDCFHLSSTNFEPTSDQGFHAPGSDPLTTPLFLPRKSPTPVYSIRDFYDLQPAGVVLESQVHHWEDNLNNLATSPEFFSAANLLDFPKYPCDLF